MDDDRGVDADTGGVVAEEMCRCRRSGLMKGFVGGESEPRRAGRAFSCPQRVSKDAPRRWMTRAVCSGMSSVVWL